MAVRTRSSSRPTSISGFSREGLRDELRQIDGAEETGAIGRQRLLAAGIRRPDLLAIAEIVGGVDAIDENHARLGIIVGRAHDALPQRPRLHRAIDFAVEHEIPRRVRFHRLHEGVRDEHRDVEIAQPQRIRLGVNEKLDIGMRAVKRAHHGPAPGASRHNGAAHGVPHIHEAHRPRSIGADAFDQRALGTQRREIMADAAALLHRQRRFAHILENGPEVVLDAAHDEAIEEGDLAARAGPCQNAPTGKKAEVGHRIIEAPGPLLLGALALLQTSSGSRHAAERIAKRRVACPTAKRLQPVFGPPDLLGDRSQKFRVVPRHAASLL